MLEFIVYFVYELNAIQVEMGQVLYSSFSKIAIIIIIIQTILAVSFYVFKSFAIYLMAKNNRIDKAFFAFIPFLNFALIGKICGPVNIFSLKFKNLGWYVTGLLAFTFTAGLVLDVLIYFDEVYSIISSGLAITEVSYAESLSLFIDITTIIFNVVSLVLYVFVIFMFVALFNKYDRRHTIIFAILIALTFSPYTFYLIFNLVCASIIFSMRKKPAFNMQAYIRYRHEMQRQMMGGYNQQPYSGQSGNNQNTSADDPFSEYSNNSSSASAFEQDVFSDFSTDSDYSQANQERRSNQNEDSISNTQASDEDDLFE